MQPSAEVSVAVAPVDRSRAFLRVSDVKISIPLSALRRAAAGAEENGRGKGDEGIESRMPRRRTFPGTFNPPVSRHDSAHITPYTYLSASLSPSLPLSLSLSRGFLALWTFYGNGTLFGVTLLNIENRTGCPPRQHVSRIRVRPRMWTECRFATTPSLLPLEFSGSRFVLIAGIYLVLRTRNTLKSRTQSIRLIPKHYSSRPLHFNEDSFLFILIYILHWNKTVNRELLH